MKQIRVVQQDGYRLVDEFGSIEHANQFLEALRMRGLSPLTIRAYAYDLVFLYRWLARAEKSLERLTGADLVEFIAHQREAKSQPRSINRRLTTTRLLFHFHTNRSLDTGPGVSFPSPYYKGPGRDHQLGLHRLSRRGHRKLRVSEPRKLVEPLTALQVRSFLRSLPRYRDLAIVHLMLLCGLRSREVLALELGDIVFIDEYVRVRGKGARERSLPLPALLARSLRQYLDFERPSRCADAHLFVVLQGKRRGKPMTVAGLRSLFRYRRRRRVVAIANPHRFRHTFGADMARAGVRLPVLQRLMGHADMSTTLQYINLSMSDIADEYRRAISELDRRYRHG